MSNQDLKKLYERVTTWQRKTFPNQTAASILKHMRLELKEIEAAPHDIEERADMAILAMGYADRTSLQGLPADIYGWGISSVDMAISLLGTEIKSLEDCMSPDRALCLSLTQFLARCSMGTGLTLQGFLSAIAAKMDKNEARRWPPPSEQVPGQPVEHVREPYEAERRSRRPGQLDAFRPTSDALVLLRDLPPGAVVRGPDTISIRDLIAERTEWRANNDRLREERQRVREILGARPNEGVIEAARRVMGALSDLQEPWPGAALAPGEEAPQ